MTTRQWPFVGDPCAYEAAHRKARKKIIDQEQQTIAAEAERFGQRLLDARRRVGLPDPDGKEWGQRMLKYQIGLRALAVGMQEESFTVAGVPTALRDWLQHPLLDRPATDTDLVGLIDLIREREAAA